MSGVVEGKLLLERLRERFAGEGLLVVVPVDAELVRRSAPFARGAILVGDGGRTFFSRFVAAGVEGPEPLDSYTRRVVRDVVAEVLAGTEFEIFHPFASEKVHLPFQRLGWAAGLPAPGPLGVQVHPTFGPWWAYRALVALATPVDGEAAMPESCPACVGPCVNDCSEHPLDGGRWVAGGLRGEIVCGDACGARLRCPVGAEARYSPEQIAFHARARAAMLARARRP